MQEARPEPPVTRRRVGTDVDQWRPGSFRPGDATEHAARPAPGESDAHADLDEILPTPKNPYDMVYDAI